MDIGTSVYFTSRRDIFSSDTWGEFGVVKYAHEGVLKCADIGEVNLVMSIGKKINPRGYEACPNIQLGDGSMIAARGM